MAALTGILPVDARAAGLEFKIDGTHEIQVDGNPSPDAKIFARRDGFLLEIPSEPTRFLVDTLLMTAFAVRKEQVLGSGDDRHLAKQQFAWSAPVSYEERVLRFHTGGAEIRLVPVDKPDPSGPAPRGVAEPAPPTAEMIVTPAVPAAADPAPACGDATGSAPTAPMPGAVARDCVSLESRPAAGVPGCTRFVYIRNRCETPVLAQVQRIEHLMTGPLPQAFNVTVRQEEWLGCAWWSGAAAPAEHAILAATFLETHGRRATGNRPPAH